MGLSSIFIFNITILKIFGVWSSKRFPIAYKIYSFLYILLTNYIYLILLSLNLLYTPRKIEIIMREGILYFTEISAFYKAIKIYALQMKVLEVFRLLDSDMFKANDEISNKILTQQCRYIRIYRGIDFYMSNIDYLCLIIFTIFAYLIFGKHLELPVCNYYFLSDETRDKYFVFLYIYQSVGIYGHMSYNISIDTLIAGLIMIAIAQLKILNHKIRSLKIDPNDLKTSKEKESEQLLKLNNYFKYFDFILKYCSKIDEILSPILFVQFAIASVSMCFTLGGLVVNSSSEFVVFSYLYLILMTLQIFIPAYLGTILSDESQKLMFAAYSCDWISRSEPFKRNLRIFIERNKTPIVLTGLSFFPVSLGTFTSIMKMAYSFFTLLRNVQFRQELQN